MTPSDLLKYGGGDPLFAPGSDVPAAMLIDDDVPSNGPVPSASNETMMYDTANCSMRQKS